MNHGLSSFERLFVGVPNTVPVLKFVYPTASRWQARLNVYLWQSVVAPR